MLEIYRLVTFSYKVDVTDALSTMLRLLGKELEVAS
jgi:hypothetical protein